VASSQPRRRVATVLFVDIVGSTKLASELGDEGWRQVLARFRQVVRAELKRWRGREQDTAGDGFYATFGEPARALRAAAAIVAAVQELGLDIRVGLHTGECEQIDGKLTGIAVHIGARLMAVAQAAEVLATRTTRDLVVGSDAGFEEAGTHELKGVDGTWLLYRLVSVAERLPGPLDPDVAAERLAEVVGGRRHRRRWPIVAVAAAIAAAIAAALAFGAFGSGGKQGTASLLRIDPTGALAVGGGAVWALEGDATLVRIDPATNRVSGRFATGAVETSILIPAAGYIWICECVTHEVLRFDPRTRATKTFHFTQQPWYLASISEHKRQTLWLLDGRDATLTRLNPKTGRTGPPLGLAGNPTEAVIAHGSIWVAAGKIVDRVVLSSGVRTAIQLPKGTHATGIAVDPVSDAVWVDNSRKAEATGPSHSSAAELSRGTSLFSTMLVKSLLLTLVLPSGWRIPYFSTAAAGDLVLTSVEQDGK
jgi:class 3 adenylate cyclase